MPEAATVEADSKLTLSDGRAPGKSEVDDSELDKLRLVIKEQADTIAASRAEADRARAEANTAQRQVLQHADVSLRAREAATETALTAIDVELATLETQIADAQGRGDFKTSAALTVKVGALQARKVQQEGYKEQVAAEKHRLEKPQAGRVTADATYTDAAGTVHDLSNYHPETQRWIRSHPNFLTDPAFQQKVIRADARAFGDGVERNTPEYFERVETEVGLRAAAAGSGQEQEVTAETPKPQRSTSTAAPVSRSASGTPNGGTGRKADLTAEEADAARISDPDLFRKDPKACYQAYMDNRDALKASGRLH